MRPALAAGLIVLAACGDRGPRVPDADVLLVTSAREDEVRLLDPATGEVVGSVSVDARESGPEQAAGVVVVPGTSDWFVVLGQAEPALWGFAGTALEPTKRVALRDLRTASRVAASPDGRFLAVTEYFLGEPTGEGRVSIMDLEADALGTATPCPAPYGLAWDARGLTLAVSCPTSDAVVLLDGTTFEGRGGFVVTSPDVGAGNLGNPSTRPMGIAWAPGGDRLYAALYRERRLGVFTPEGDPLMQVDLEGHPVNLAVTGRGRYVVVTTRQSPTLTVVDTRSWEAMALSLEDADSPHALTLAPDGRTAFVAFEGTENAPGGVLAVDLDAGEVTWRTETGPMTTGIAYRAAPSSAGSGGASSR